MKLLESYKKIAKNMLTEQAWDREFGEPLPTLDDVMREKWDVGRGVDPDATDANIDKDLMDKQIVYTDDDGIDATISVRGALKQGEDHPAYDDAKKMVDKAKDGEKEEPKGKGLEPDDFEREFDDKPFGGDTGVDADFGYEDDEEARAQAFKDMEDEMEEESITINGKKYKPIKDSVEPTIFDPKKHLLREMYEKIGGK